MKILGSRSAAMFASAAALALVSTPALARGWDGNGWGHHRDNDDTGAWVVGGIIGIGIIAAIASAASKSNRDHETRDRSERYPGDGYGSQDSRGGDYAYGNRGGSNDSQTYGNGGSSIDGAVESCVGRVERGSTRVDIIDSVAREGEGWRIAGRVGGGRSFGCLVDSGGRVREVSVDGRALDL